MEQKQSAPGIYIWTRSPIHLLRLQSSCPSALVQLIGRVDLSREKKIQVLCI